MNAHILTYQFTEDYIAKRAPYRKAHFDYISTYINRQEILLGGATSDPADKGILIFDKLAISEIDIFVKNDPYFKNGIVTEYQIQKWTVVAGSMFSTE